MPFTAHWLSQLEWCKLFLLKGNSPHQTTTCTSMCILSPWVVVLVIVCSLPLHTLCMYDPGSQEVTVSRLCLSTHWPYHLPCPQSTHSLVSIPSPQSGFFVKVSFENDTISSAFHSFMWLASPHHVQLLCKQVSTWFRSNMITSFSDNVITLSSIWFELSNWRDTVTTPNVTKKLLRTPDPLSCTWESGCETNTFKRSTYQLAMTIRCKSALLLPGVYELKISSCSYQRYSATFFFCCMLHPQGI